MSAASTPATAPLYEEGTRYWDQLLAELKRHTAEINTAATQHGFAADSLLRWRPAPGFDVQRAQHPSTGIRADLAFHSWGPAISGSITGYQAEDTRFLPKEFELAIARDLDGAIVGVFDEGRSFSPPELAAYLMQHFRRCFPELSLPCDCDSNFRALPAA